jgi:hypothetical protein
MINAPECNQVRVETQIESARKLRGRQWRGLIAPALGLALVGCVSANEVADRIGKPPEHAAQLRETQSRRLDIDEPGLLTDGAQVLQDLGFSISESSSSLGVLVGNKSRDATESGQVAAQIALTLIAAALLVPYAPTWDTAQNIQVTVVTMPDTSSRQTVMRAFFERVVTTNQGAKRYELLDQPGMYQEFFKRVGDSIAISAKGT